MQGFRATAIVVAGTAGVVLAGLTLDRLLLASALPAAELGGVRVIAAAACVSVGLAVGLVLQSLLRRRNVVEDHQSRFGHALQEQELLLGSRYRELGAQLARCRDILSTDMVSLGTQHQHLLGTLEMRFASIEAALKRIDDTLTERLEGMAALVSHSLQSTGRGGDAAQAGRALDEHLHRIDRHLDRRLEDLEARITQFGNSQFGNSQPAALIDLDTLAAPLRYDSSPAELSSLRELQSRVGQLDGRIEQLQAQSRNHVAELGAMLVRLDRRLEHPALPAPGLPPVELDALRQGVDQLARRLDGVEAWLRHSGERMGHQLTDLSQRLSAGPSVNNSVFDELPAGNGVPAEGSQGAQIQSLMLNLAHLQVDLRAERSQLRKRLRELGAPGEAATGSD